MNEHSSIIVLILFEVVYFVFILLANSFIHYRFDILAQLRIPYTIEGGR